METLGKMALDLGRQYFHKIVAAAAMLLIFLAAGYVLGAILRRLGRSRDKRTQKIFNLLAVVTRTLFVILGVSTALGTLGIDISAIVAGLGLTGFALGFALKDGLSNLLAGVMIIIYRPFEIGDTIEIMGSRGNVADIDLRYTALQYNGETHLIPNSLCLSNKIIRIKPPVSSP